MQRIYCVEDDTDIRELVLYALNAENYMAEGFVSGKELFIRLEQETPSLILLDIMLPEQDGMQILKQIRASERTKHIPVIMLTAKSSEIDKVKGLDGGADDYITKPFGIMELISRVKAVVRRTKPQQASTIALDKIQLDTDARVVTVDGEVVTLTYKEYELLWYLAKNRGIVMSRDKLMDKIWGYDFEGESRTVDVHIRTLRQKLCDDGTIIKTVRNVGYMVV